MGGYHKPLIWTEEVKGKEERKNREKESRTIRGTEGDK